MTPVASASNDPSTMFLQSTARNAPNCTVALSRSSSGPLFRRFAWTLSMGTLPICALAPKFTGPASSSLSKKPSLRQPHDRSRTRLGQRATL